MIAINKNSVNPWFNLAADEFVVKNIQDEVVMIWQNTDCVVIGKHQNAVAEVNRSFLELHQIPAIRRISGGGTVFQGKGNINYSFVTNTIENQDKINFKKYTSPILNFLESIGVRATFSGKSNLTIDGLKFSGNAAHLHKNRILHHGTLLFDADLTKIEQAIDVTEKTYTSKAIVSIRAQMCNIRPHLANDMGLEEFEKKLSNFVQCFFNIQNVREFTTEEVKQIEQLSEEKYKSWDWNFGYSPEYTYFRVIEWNGRTINLRLSVQSGKFKIVDVQPDAEVEFNSMFHSLIEKKSNFSSVYDCFLKFPAFISLSNDKKNKIVHQLL